MIFIWAKNKIDNTANKFYQSVLEERKEEAFKGMVRKANFSGYLFMHIVIIRNSLVLERDAKNHICFYVV